MEDNNLTKGQVKHLVQAIHKIIPELQLKLYEAGRQIAEITEKVRQQQNSNNLHERKL